VEEDLAFTRTCFSFIKLPKAERFACNKSDIKNVFGTDMLGWVGTRTENQQNSNGKGGYSPRPKFAGPIVASLSVSHLSDSRPILILFAIGIDQYSDEASDEFGSEILPKMKTWLDQQLAKPETSKFGYAEYFVAEWTGKVHRIHYLRWR
jgi:hypothetical protein